MKWKRRLEGHGRQCMRQVRMHEDKVEEKEEQMKQYMEEDEEEETETGRV